MIDIPCVLLGIYPAERKPWEPDDGTRRWLIAFDDPQRSLNLTNPCYIAEEDIDGWWPVHLPSGEIRAGPHELFGPCLVRLPDNLWANAHNITAIAIEAERRRIIAEAAEEQKAAQNLPRNVRKKKNASPKPMPLKTNNNLTSGDNQGLNAL